MRRRPKEIALICDTASPLRPLPWTAARRFPFDTAASEVYPEMGGLDAEARLMQEIPAYCGRE